MLPCTGRFEKLVSSTPIGKSHSPGQTSQMRISEETNLVSSDLTDADLTIADLTDATLWEATLAGSTLHGTDLTGANLTGTELWEADLYWPLGISPKQYPDQAKPVLSIEDLLREIQKLNNYYDAATTLYFRGEFECGWDLRPSVMRDQLVIFESDMLVELMSRRPEEFNGMASALAQWVLAQHYGLQTRFLDITKNPLIALFHACDKTGGRKQNEEDGRLQVFAVPRALVKPFNSDVISIIANAARLHADQQGALLGKRYFLGNNRIRRENDHQEAMHILYQLIRQVKPYFEERIDPRDLYQVFVVEPQQSSERIQAQSGAFLVSAFHERFERKEVLEWNKGIPLYAHYTLTVRGEYKDAIMEELQLLNITHETLFPGLDSSARSVTESYGSFIEQLNAERDRR